MKKVSICLLYPEVVPEGKETFFDEIAELQALIESHEEFSLASFHEEPDMCIAVLAFWTEALGRHVIEASQQNMNLWCCVPWKASLSALIMDEIKNRSAYQSVRRYDKIEEIYWLLTHQIDRRVRPPIAAGTMIESGIRQRLIEIILKKRVFQTTPRS